MNAVARSSTPATHTPSNNPRAEALLTRLRLIFETEKPTKDDWHDARQTLEQICIELESAPKNQQKAAR